MKLIRALRINSPPRIAFVGAGGKTTAILRLAHELLSGVDIPFKCISVIVTTTTHLFISQLSESDHHVIVNTSSDLQKIFTKIPAGLSIITGPEVEERKVSGLQPAILDEIAKAATENEIPVLIEADGSRQKPLKAPAAHEPVIPEWVDTVVVVAGMAGLGAPLNQENVHRAKIFSDLTGLALEKTVTPSALKNLLIHSQGGLKNIPPNAKRVVLLNQADTPRLQSEAYSLARELFNNFQAVLICSLNPRDRINIAINEQEKYSFWEQETFAVHEPAAGIILAAGGSVRMGNSKLIMPLDGEPLINHVTKAAVQSDLSSIVVVLGAFHEEVKSVLTGQLVSYVMNDNWRNGQSTSIIAGLEIVQSSVGSVVFILADQPFISGTLINHLVEAHARTLDPIVAPIIDGQRGNPVLFDRRTFPDLMNLQGDAGGRQLFPKYRVTWIPWNDSLSLLDVDTPEDYELVKTALKSHIRNDE